MRAAHSPLNNPSQNRIHVSTRTGVEGGREGAEREQIGRREGKRWGGQGGRDKRKERTQKRKGTEKKSKERTGDNANLEGGLGELRRAADFLNYLFKKRHNPHKAAREAGPKKQRLLFLISYLICMLVIPKLARRV